MPDKDETQHHPYHGEGCQRCAASDAAARRLWRKSVLSWSRDVYIARFVFREIIEQGGFTAAEAGHFALLERMAAGQPGRGAEDTAGWEARARGERGGSRELG